MIAARCSLPARFSFGATSATVARITTEAVTYARWRRPRNTARPTTAADGPVSTTHLPEAGSPSGESGPSRMPRRA